MRGGWQSRGVKDGIIHSFARSLATLIASSPPWVVLTYLVGRVSSGRALGDSIGGLCCAAAVLCGRCRWCLAHCWVVCLRRAIRLRAVASL